MGGAAALLLGTQFVSSEGSSQIDQSPVHETSEPPKIHREFVGETQTPSLQPTDLQNIQEMNRQWAEQLLSCVNDKLLSHDEGVKCEKREVTVHPGVLDSAQEDQNYSQIHCDGNYEVHSYLQQICEDVMDLNSCQVEAVSSIYELTAGADSNLLSKSLGTVDPWGEVDLTANNSRVFTPQDLENSVQKSCENLVELWEMMQEDGGFTQMESEKRLKRTQKLLGEELIRQGISPVDHDESLTRAENSEGIKLLCFFFPLSAETKVLWNCAPTNSLVSVNDMVYQLPSYSCTTSGTSNDFSEVAKLASCKMEYILKPYGTEQEGISLDPCEVYLELLPKFASGDAVMQGASKETQEKNRLEYEANCVQ